MTTSKAIKIMENRHSFILHKLRTGGYEDGRVNFMIGEAAAVEIAVAALAEKLLHERALKAARHATWAYLDRSSC